MSALPRVCVPGLGVLLSTGSLGTANPSTAVVAPRVRAAQAAAAQAAALWPPVHGQHSLPPCQARSFSSQPWAPNSSSGSADHFPTEPSGNARNGLSEGWRIQKLLASHSFTEVSQDELSQGSCLRHCIMPEDCSIPQ